MTKLENGVPKFQPLIVKMVTLGFVTDTGVCQRLLQQERVAKLVADPVFQRVHP